MPRWKIMADLYPASVAEADLIIAEWTADLSGRLFDTDRERILPGRTWDEEGRLWVRCRVRFLTQLGCTFVWNRWITRAGPGRLSRHLCCHLDDPSTWYPCTAPEAQWQEQIL